MDNLLDRILFRKEWSDGKVDNVLEYANSGRAKLFRTGEFTSFSVKESYQGDVKHLPTGARTLLLNASSNEVVVRGVNKFFDIEDIEMDLLESNDFWKLGRVWLQRKMAGFTVTLFSLDGESVGVATKHVVEGPHVDVARRVLDSLLNAEQQKRLASELFLGELAVSCECISAENDPHHPVMEEEKYNNSLFVFSLHKRNNMREISVPFEIMQSMVLSWGMSVVSCWSLENTDKLQKWLRERESWVGKDPNGAPLAEGYVLMVEIPKTRLEPLVTIKGPFTIVPLRLKAKSVKYRVLRSLRSIALGESKAPLQLFHEIFVVWSLNIGGFKCFRSAIEEHGIFKIYLQFEAYVRERSCTRHRGSVMSIGQAFERLLEFTERETCSKQCTPLHVIMLCGLPGSGKSTLARAMIEVTERGCSPFQYVINLNRDQVYSDVAVQEGIDSSCSKHKQRKLRSMAHHAMVVAINRVMLFSFLQKGPGLLILDACNARSETRRLWRNILPKEINSFRLIYVTCSDHIEHMRRLLERRDHDVIHDASEAQAALYAVKKAFVEPMENEPCVHLDTSTSLASEMAQEILSYYEKDQQYHTSLYDYRRLETELKSNRKLFIESLIGPVDMDASPLLMRSYKRVKRANTMVVRLDLSFDKLLNIATAAIKSVTEPEVVTLSWWEKCKRALQSLPLRFTAKVEEGHTRWVRGWLLDGWDTSQPLSTEVWCQALEERLECKSLSPHITLLYDTTDAETSSSDPTPGNIAEVTLDSVLLDRSALCFGVTVTINEKSYVKQLSSTESIPLHVTLGHTSHVKASYTGMMFDLFQKWEKHNKELEETKHGALVKRSRLKFFNFLKVRLETSVSLRGVVVVET
ncbi:RNA ligase T4 Rnl1 [Trypanosoma melophagium]|uniref:RNA ligase T4 Rnl1 n=1 Tax=Trypanosoma melophagium TaxID=715481 RepID=UPI00351A7267|nr:RNA ligase T4 Rnl1 [Trypanosoma melophagium]